MEQSTSLLSESFQKEEAFFDVPFTIEEVEHAVNRIKLKKSAGPDILTAEHLKYEDNEMGNGNLELSN